MVIDCSGQIKRIQWSDLKVLHFRSVEMMCGLFPYGFSVLACSSRRRLVQQVAHGGRRCCGVLGHEFAEVVDGGGVRWSMVVA